MLCSWGSIEYLTIPYVQTVHSDFFQSAGSLARLWKSSDFIVEKSDKSSSSQMCLVSQSCLTLCNPMAYSLRGSSVEWDSPGKNTRVGCHVLLQGIFSTQGSNPGLPHCRQTLYPLSHQGIPFLLLFKIYIGISSETLNGSKQTKTRFELKSF